MALATFNNRKFWLGSLLLLTILAAAWPVPDREPISAAADSMTASRRHGQTAMNGQASIMNVAFAPLGRTTAPGKHAAIGDLFPQQTWAPPPPPVVQQTPVAPPLPFTFGGRYTDGNKVTIFLMEGNQMHRLQQGETIKETYRVEKIEQASISLTYLPLGTTQILPTGVLQP